MHAQPASGLNDTYRWDERSARPWCSTRWGRQVRSSPLARCLPDTREAADLTPYKGNGAPTLSRNRLNTTDQDSVDPTHLDAQPEQTTPPTPPSERASSPWSTVISSALRSRTPLESPDLIRSDRARGSRWCAATTAHCITSLVMPTIPVKEKSKIVGSRLCHRRWRH